MPKTLQPIALCCEWCKNNVKLTDVSKARQNEYYRSKKTLFLCSKECAKQYLASKSPTNITCSVCGKEMNWSNMTKSQRQQYRKSNGTRVYCSVECSEKVIQEARCRKGKMSIEARKRISQRMKKDNPMSKEENRIKMSNRLKEIGHCPKVRYGNGCGLTVPQQELLTALKSLEPCPEYPVLTGYGKGNGTYPSCYKIDVAIPSAMLAIEVDGGSHGLLTRQAEDQKKTEFLNGLGWKVLRFKNRQLMEHLEDCVQIVMSTI